MDIATIQTRFQAFIESSRGTLQGLAASFALAIESLAPKAQLDRFLGQYGIGIALGAFAALAALMLLRSRRKSWRRAGPTMTLGQAVRGPMALGWTTIVLVFVAGGVLGSLVPLAGAAVAPGFVSPDGYRKTVQHLEGGIVHRIHVREGDVVRSGQHLLTMEDTAARANLSELRDRLAHFLAMEARLLAEQSGADAVPTVRGDEMLDEPTLALALGGQRDLFKSRRETRAGRERILGQRMLQLNEEIGGLREVIVSQDTQMRLIRQEIVNVKDLFEKGLERLPRLLALQRAEAEVGGGRASNVARIAKNKQAIGEAEMELLTMRQQDREKVNEEINTVRTELAALRSKLPARVDILTRTVVAAPISGTVMNVKVTTETGVVRPGESLLEIVPHNAGLIVDARVKPIDVDVVRPGMSAKVVLSAFTQRSLPEFRGRLRSISADRLTDERTGESYFAAKVEVDAAQIRALGEQFELSSGMPADVYILTGERTAIDYLVRPFIESITKSFRET